MPRYEGMTGLMLLGLAMMVIGGLVAGLCTAARRAWCWWLLC